MSDAGERERWGRASAQLDELFDLDDEAARAARLAALAQEDPALAAEVTELLAASRAPDALLDRDGVAAAAVLSGTTLSGALPLEPVPADAIPGRIGPWEIVGVLGEGGMGSVFAAERRGEGFVQRAAVKVLHGGLAGLAASALRQRFLEERRILSGLEHPGIARMLDGGMTDDGSPYLAMERVDGTSITEACRARCATVEERLALFLEVCAAVEHAHRQRVVHRDLKPSNVMVDRDGRVKLLDFGIAKLLAPDGALEGAGGERAPTLLRALTPRYAAPEQITGGAVTPATDVHALGVLLFELLAGRLPWEVGDESSYAVEQAVLRDEPARLSRAAIPDASRPEGERLARRLAGDLERIVARALTKEPERRYPSAAELADDLRRHLAGEAVVARGDAPAYRLGRFARRHRTALLAAALALSLAALTALAILQIGHRAGPAAGQPAERAPVVAVLSFAPRGGAEPWLATALSEGVAAELGRTPGISVLASASVAGMGDDEASQGRLRGALGATHAVTGSVESEGETVRVQAALVDLASRRTLWAGHLDGEVGARLAARAELARRLAWELLERLGAATGEPRPAAPPTRDPRAWEAYQRGLAELSGCAPGGVGPEERLAATVQLELAVALDPGFAEAWARLGTVYAKRLFHDAPSADLEERAFAAVQRALALDPRLAEAYLARAQLSWTLSRGFDHARAVADLRRAVELHPSLAEAHLELCKVHFHVGLTDRALAECDRALALDPANRTALGRKLSLLADAGRDAEVAALLAARGGELSPGIRAGLLIDIGRHAEALPLLLGDAGAKRVRDPEFGWPAASRGALERIWAAVALARLGRREEAAAILARAEITAETVEEQSHLHHAFYFAGAAHALLGNREEALRWLERAAAEGYPSYPRFARDADLASLAGEPRFIALLSRLERDRQRWEREL